MSGRGHIRERRGATGVSYEIRVKVGARMITRTVRAKDTSRAAEREAKRAAERLRTQLLAEVDEGAHVGQPGTVADLVTRWLEAASPSWSPKTKNLYEDCSRLHLFPTLGHVQVTQLRTHDLDALYGTLSLTLAPSSVRKVHNLIRGALDQAVKWGWCARNVAYAASPPKIRVKELEVPTAEQIRELLTLAAETDPDYACVLRVLADLGCRRGELAALRWSDIDFGEGTVTISKSIVHDRQALVEKHTKTDRARRVALSSSTLDELRQHRTRWAERALACGAAIPEHVFASTDPKRFGQVARPESITQRFVRLRARAGLDNVRLHDLRHWSITTALASGADQRTVMGRSGHASLASLTRYSHFVPAADRKAADLLGRALDG